MLSTVKTYLAHQARKPFGWFGRIVAPRVFEKTNKYMEDFGLKLMNPQKDDHILEIGFGHGRLLSDLVQENTDGKVYGIDISEQMVQVTAKQNREWIDKGKLEIKQASIADIPYPDNHFDKVFTCNTIYFWPDPVENIREVRRVLNPKGELYCTFRDRELMESKSSAVTENPEVFQNLYQSEEVKQLFQDGGFRDVFHKKNTINSEEVHVIIGKN